MNYDELRKLITLLNKKKLKTKKDLVKLKAGELKKYLKYRTYLRVDGRLKPLNVIRQFKKYRKTSRYFKAIDLHFNPHNFTLRGVLLADKYKAGRSLASYVTTAMQEFETELNDIHKETRQIDVAYNRRKTKQGLTIKVSDLDFMQGLPNNIYINIDGTAYNKNGLDFIHDYLNQSEDFVGHGLMTSADSMDIFIYRRF